ncbi:hypothetical protein [Pyxidicoccus xibeiensis]|uniref:hypothetical protein n=1 Tax=Pyxidicoccus xibeiensis TaxID=2906759 RepID=UPI0020A76F94|nr:hypothetical protein [Pyxidicoccus xibeiensis]
MSHLRRVPHHRRTMRAAYGQREHHCKRLLGWLEAELLQARAHVLDIEVAVDA